jgi:tetratricopeptide (TPR) repeat protein
MIRLLKCDAGEFSLVSFADNLIPEYAILSHTWGPDSEEVNYEDITQNKGKDKSGYDKLRFCAAQAARHGLVYFWIDSCCINKSSEPELGEAIRSMLRWYAGASRCYVYLWDVPDPKDATSTIESAFAKSRWFTRGWTLQELIAPKSVEFFSKTGESLGNKDSRVQQLHEITGIHIKALQGAPMAQFTIDDRMSWAKDRKTTREEDTAYCLLGIFGMHIPVMYGEGRESAMARLWEQIRLSMREASRSDPLWIVPFERNPRFTGREALLAQLENTISVNSHTSKVAITGLGGMGKTQLVLELLHRVKSKHRNHLIMWIPVTSADSLHQGYLTVAQRLKIPGWEGEKSNAEQLVRDYLCNYDLGQWILVFDNVDDLDIWTISHDYSQSSRGLIDHIPTNKQGSVIFTTRDRKIAVKLANNVINMPEMDEETATVFLKKCLINPGLVDSQQETQALLRELTFLPLAIVQAAAYINENSITLAEYHTLLADNEEEAIDVLSEEFEDDGRYREVRNPVAATWLISFEQIQRRDALAAEYLSFMACIDPKDIPQSLLPPGPSRNKQTTAIGTLSAYSFISRRPAEAMLDLHRLVHLATRNWLRKEGQLIKWTEKAIIRLEEVFPDLDHKNRTTWRTYLPHVRRVLESDQLAVEGQTLSNLKWRYARCLYSDGRWDEAEVIFSQALEEEKGIHDKHHPLVLTKMNLLASTYWYQGRLKEAEDLFAQILESHSKVLSAEHPDRLGGMIQLASTFLLQGRWNEAEDLFLQVVDTRKRVLGADHPSTLLSINNLAATYRIQGRWKEAEELELQVTEKNKRVLGIEHPETLTSMSNLAVTYTSQGRYEEAVDIDLQLIETRKRVLGAEHPDTLLSMSNLVEAYMGLCRWNEAEDLNLKLIDKRKRVLGVEHLETLTSMSNLALIYWEQGRCTEAEVLNLEVIDKRKMVIGMEHPSTLTSMSNLALVYRDQDRLRESEDLNLQVLETRTRTFGAEHPDTLLSVWNLAITLKWAGRSTEAIQLLQKCVGLQKKILGSNHPYTCSSSAMLMEWQAEELSI